MGFIEFYNRYINDNTAIKNNLGKKNHSSRFADLCFETDLGIRYKSADEYLIDEKQLRRIEIVRNLSGHPSYLLDPMDGYIVTIFDLSSNRKSLTPKPMRIIDEAENYITFRGYRTIVGTLLGWESIDMSDYGVTVYLEEGYIKGCILHRFDTGVNYVYGISSSMRPVHIEGSIITAQITADSIIKKGFNFNPKSFMFYYCGQVTAYGQTEVKVVAKIADNHKQHINLLLIGSELADKIDSSIDFDLIIQLEQSRIYLLAQNSSIPEDGEVNKRPSSCMIQQREKRLKKSRLT